MDFLWLLIPFSLIFGINLVLMIRRGMQFKQLASGGMAGKATILRKYRRKNKSTRLQYEFTAPTGEVLRHSSVVSKAQFESAREGGEIEIYFLLENPKINAPKYLIDAARQAIQKTE